jgi:signal transduction histidine kinase
MDSVVAAWRRWARWPATDVILAVTAAVILTWGSYGEGNPQQTSDVILFHGHPAPHPTAALVLVAVACLVLAWRRRYPVAVLAVAAAAVTAYSLLGYVNGAAILAPIIALYAVATLRSARWSIPVGLVTVGVLMAATAVGNPFGQITGGGFYLIPGMGAAVVFGGIALANRRAYVTSIRARAEQDAQRRIDEERLRIARELHDVVSHTMATINVQAAVAAHVLPARPEAAAEAVAAIRTASKEGLQELRAILNVLRQADDADPTQPAPGTAQLGTLVAGARQAGLDTTFTVTGTPVPLPAAVDLAAYRIVQESLTNTIRHAGPATAAVSLTYRDADLLVEVTDTGRGPQAAPAVPGAGHGLAGMRERAAAVGGTVEAAPGQRDGFRVTARLPVPAQPLPVPAEPVPVPAQPAPVPAQPASAAESAEPAPQPAPEPEPAQGSTREGARP